MAGARVSTLRLAPAREARRRAPGAIPQAKRARRRAGARVELDAQPVHARGVGQLLDTALDVLVSRFGPCVAIAAACWMPYQIATELVLSSRLNPALQLIWSMGSMVPEVLTTACVCSFVGAYLLRTKVSAFAAMRNGLGAGVGVVVIGVMQSVTTAVLFLCCILPFVLGYWLFSAVPSVYVLDRKALVEHRTDGLAWPVRWVAGILLSVQRGVRLVLGLGSLGRWAGWASVSFIAILGPLTLFPAALQNANVKHFMEQVFSIQGRPIELTLSAISAIFVGVGTAYFAVLKTVYYLDQRVRKESFDLELRLDGLIARAEPLVRE